LALLGYGLDGRKNACVPVKQGCRKCAQQLASTIAGANPGVFGIVALVCMACESCTCEHSTRMLLLNQMCKGCCICSAGLISVKAKAALKKP